MKKRFLNCIALVATIFSCVNFALAQRTLDGYNRVPPDVSDVVEAANFAVAEANKKEEGTKITLTCIISAQKRVVAGTKYRLCLNVKINDESEDVVALIFRSLKQEWSLESWTHENCGGNK